MIQLKTTYEFDIEIEIDSWDFNYNYITGRDEIESDYDIYLIVKDSQGKLNKIKLDRNKYKSVYEDMEDDVNDEILKHLDDLETDERLSRIA
jgi:hypothetical protein